MSTNIYIFRFLQVRISSFAFVHEAAQSQKFAFL